MNSLSNLGTFTALSDRAKGAISLIDPEGNPYNFVGTESKLYVLRHDTTDATRASGEYNASAEAFWEFAIFGRTVIAVNGADVAQYYMTPEATEFKDLGNPELTNTLAPRAKHIGIIGSFVVLGNTDNDSSEIHWSAVNDPFNWPEPGTDVARAVQSDRQILEGAGGAVQRVVSGSEVATIFQERAIWRAEYQGGDVVFNLIRVEPDRGLLIPAIAVSFGRQVFYLGEDGFYLSDYTTSTPIGRGVVDSTFLADIDTSLFHRVSAVADPDNQRIWILYPGSGHVAAGTPNKFLVYDWGLNRWSHGEIAAEWLTQCVDVALTLDTPGSIGDPDTTSDDDDYALGGVDGVHRTTLIPLGSFDARVSAPGALKLGAYSLTHFLQDFSGSALSAVLETGRRELIPGSRSMATRARIVIDGVNPTLEVAGLRRSNDTELFTRPSRIDEDGDAPIRKDARYHTFRINAGSGFSDALYLDVFCQRSGRR